MGQIAREIRGLQGENAELRNRLRTTEANVNTDVDSQVLGIRAYKATARPLPSLSMIFLRCKRCGMTVRPYMNGMSNSNWPNSCWPNSCKLNNGQIQQSKLSCYSPNYSFEPLCDWQPGGYVDGSLYIE